MNGAHVPVDSWALRHELPDPGDGEKPALWLVAVERELVLGGQCALSGSSADEITAFARQIDAKYRSHWY